MRKVPQQVVVVTAAVFDKDKKMWKKRGITCSSFTSVSFFPPIVSFCLYKHSSMHDLLQSVDQFALHVLANNQVRHAMHFANNPGEGSCQFEAIPHVQGKEGLPIIIGSLAVLLCRVHSIHTVGDHQVWYSRVTGVSVSEHLQDPLLYFIRSFCSVGDEVFLQAFEHATLPFEDWSHEAHIRMAWNYIREYGRDAATPHIKLGIQKFNEQNKDKIKTGYHETITVFFIHMVANAIKSCNPDMQFHEFLEEHRYLCDGDFMFQYYNKHTLFSEEARHRFIPPDKKPLP
ncbi:uncharacterized protein LOC121380213 isoform X2 [Gigantopelta aegis]|nr:uncharacterized protein LOC121380213 isoform X2 [Gigantopelta aegis]